MIDGVNRYLYQAMLNDKRRFYPYPGLELAGGVDEETWYHHLATHSIMESLDREEEAQAAREDKEKQERALEAKKRAEGFDGASANPWTYRPPNEHLQWKM
jgi:hypothetical protein